MLSAVSDKIISPQLDNQFSLSKNASTSKSDSANYIISDYVDISSEKDSDSSWQEIAANDKPEAIQTSSVKLSENFKRSIINYLENSQNNFDLSYSDSNAPESYNVFYNSLNNFQPVTASLSNGTSVNIAQMENGSAKITLDTSNGQTLEIDNITSNVRFSTNENGQIQMVSKDSITTFDQFGNIISTTEGSDPLQGTKKDDIIINFDGNNIDAGDGNDLIINFSAQANIDAGKGNDKVIIAGRNELEYKLNINLGDGNDNFEAGDMSRADINISGGNGDDNIKLGNISSAQNIVINAGNGNDKITTGKIIGPNATIQIDGGSGDDKISSTGIFGEKINISGDDGNDNINIGYIFSRNEGNININGGSGNDTIKIGTAINSIIDGGDGDDDISVETMWRSLMVNGAGSDNIFINNMVESMILSQDSLKAELWDTDTESTTASEEVVDNTNNNSNSFELLNNTELLHALQISMSKGSNIYGLSQNRNGSVSPLTLNDYL